MAGWYGQWLVAWESSESVGLGRATALQIGLGFTPYR